MIADTHLPRSRDLWLGLDTGGTFTDAVLLNAEQQVVASAKSLTTHWDLSIGISGAIRNVLATLPEGSHRSDVSLVSVSTTLATNAVVENRFSPTCTLLIGFDDGMEERSGLSRERGSIVVRVGGGHDATGVESAPLEEAVIDAAAQFGRAMPMMMTAAGTIAPARVLVMGVGVAGLQAIATAKRLGAIVSATDVRPATKEQVESLGGTFVAVMDEEFKNAQTAGGYAKEMSPEYQAKQAALIAETIKKQDIIITTALIPGRKAPVLVSEEMIKTMKPGSVIVDLAAEAGGNTPLTKANEVIEIHGVTIMGYTNLPGRLAVDSSSLYSRNLFNFISLIVDKKTGQLAIDWNDEIIKGSALTRDGEVIHPVSKG